MTDRPWPAGSATTIGSLPGTEPDAAATLVLGELPDLPHLPELPDRGPGADMIGRSAGLLLNLPVEIAASGWRLCSHDGREVRRARDFVSRDLDALEQAADGYVGALKVQATGPWTLAANLELPSGHRVVSDHGATRDLAESLAEGVRVHLEQVQRRIPGARLVLQLDEPSVPTVLAGEVPTASGYGTVRSVERSLVESTLRDVLAVAEAGGRVVHCCAPSVPIEVMRAAGADAISLDAGLLRRAQNDAVGEAIDAGISFWLGVFPSTDSAVSLDGARAAVRTLWSELGFAPAEAAAAIVATPTCGLAGATPGYVRRVLSLLRDVGKSLRDDAS